MKLITMTVNTLSTTAVELLSILCQIMLFHHISSGFFLAFKFQVFWPIPGETRPLDKEILLPNPAWTYSIQIGFFVNKQKKFERCDIPSETCILVRVWICFTVCLGSDPECNSYRISFSRYSHIGWQPLSLKMCDLCDLRFIHRNVQKGREISFVLKKKWKSQLCPLGFL